MTRSRVPADEFPPAEGTASGGISLSPAQAELIDYFSSLADLFSLPRSAGQIYGLLFGQARPLSFDEIVAALSISKGSASGSLKLLRKLKAVNAKRELGDRRTFFAAETSVRHLIQSFLQDGVKNHLKESQSRLREIAALVEQEQKDSRRTASALPHPHLTRRLASLEVWHRKAGRLLPWIARLTLSSPKKKNDHSEPDAI